jgi:hypothetical protein
MACDNRVRMCLSSCVHSSLLNAATSIICKCSTSAAHLVVMLHPLLLGGGVGSKVCLARGPVTCGSPLAQVLYSVFARALGLNRSNLDAGVLLFESASAFLSSSKSCWTSLSLKRTHRLLKRRAGKEPSASHRYTQVGVTRRRSANSRTVSNRSIWVSRWQNLQNYKTKKIYLLRR